MLLASLAACSAPAGCGGKADRPALARGDTAQLVSLADRIASEGPCAQRRDIGAFRGQALRLVTQRRVPVELEAPFVKGVNALVTDVPPCLPAVPAVRPSTPPAVPEAGGPEHGKRGRHGHERGHGHGHDKGNH